MPITLDSSEQDGNKETKVQIKRILVPIDGSGNSIRAAKYAIEIAKLQKARIVCIHVISSLPYASQYSYSVVDRYFRDVKALANGWFDEIIQTAHVQGIDDIKTGIFTDVASVPDAITRYADDNSIDLIVVGSKGRTGLKRFIMGSVANGVLNHAHCPVLVVR